MIRARQVISRGASQAGPAPPAHLPYVVELWNLPRTAPERIIARAANMTLARAIFVAAQQENLGRRLVLRRGGEVLAEAD